ncbi:MAG TPA: thioredoxin family protein [Candidatus Dormibacteraeota bacterium]
MDRLLVLAAVALGVAFLVLAARALAGARTRRARALAPAEVWQALDTRPDGPPAVVLFSTPSCAECATQRALLRDVRVIEVDASARPEVAARFGVLTAPTTAILDGEGRVRALNHGFAGAERLAAQLA